MRSALAHPLLGNGDKRSRVYLKKLPLRGAVVVLHTEEAVNGALRSTAAGKRVPRVDFVQMVCSRGGRMANTYVMVPSTEERRRHEANKFYAAVLLKR